MSTNQQSLFLCSIFSVCEYLVSSDSDNVTIGTFCSMDLASFHFSPYLITTYDHLITRYAYPLSIFSQDLQSSLCLHSLLLLSMLCMAMFFFSSLLFDALCITHVYTSILCTAHLISTTHSPGLRVFLMHSVSVDLIQSCTYSMSSI